ncbi:hypothetical protein BDEG_21777 [Batrachochytrium dendrobatidis JEL423]|uniref:SH3 domain-containing protein n=1 Tax=Batrachochytrium dendrobatidis (strain JEL423) TaxID=403673 RepID=A0A177WDG0_BATDL|nr:hypothetical protein BDEG_21777 [Batrachochytrium dendrobatidis JEL423]
MPATGGTHCSRVFPVAVLILLVSSTGAQNPECFSLKDSTSCPQFAGESTRLLNAYSVRKDNSNPPLFNNVASLDSYIHNSAPTSAGFQSFVKSFLKCPGWDGSGVRYSQSFNCGLVVANSAVCNPGVQPFQLCQATAKYFTDSIESLFKNPEFCPAGSTRNVPAPYLSFVNSLKKNDPLNKRDCLIAQDVEFGMCGFGTKAEIEAYCLPNNPSKDPCCDAAVRLGNIGTSTTTTTTIGVVANPTANTLGTASPSLSIGASGTRNASTQDSQQPNAEGTTSNSSSSESQTGLLAGKKPILIGGTIAAVGLVVAAVFMFVIGRRRAIARNAQIENGNLSGNFAQVTDTMEVIYEYFPNLHDEIELHVGDHIIIKTIFDDGWAFGYNMVTKQEGSFPMECVGPIGSAHPSPHDSMATRRRVSSMRVTSQYK